MELTMESEDETFLETVLPTVFLAACTMTLERLETAEESWDFMRADMVVMIRLRMQEWGGGGFL